LADRQTDGHTKQSRRMHNFRSRARAEMVTLKSWCYLLWYSSRRWRSCTLWSLHFLPEL